jgi:hypothetical protein
MKVKLAIVECSEAKAENGPIEYFYNDDRIKEWYYSPKDCFKTVMTEF